MRCCCAFTDLLGCVHTARSEYALIKVMNAAGGKVGFEFFVVGLEVGVSTLIRAMLIIK